MGIIYSTIGGIAQNLIVLSKLQSTAMYCNECWLVLWENRPLWGWKERFTHPCVTMIILWASLKADIFWLPYEFLVLLTPNIHAFFNISTNWGSFQYAKITLFFNPEEGDFLTTRIKYLLKNRVVTLICKKADNSSNSAPAKRQISHTWSLVFNRMYNS